MKALFVIGILFIGSFAHADRFRVDRGAHTVGNGGVVIVCDPHTAREKVLLLDFWEAEKFRGIKIDLGTDKLTLDEKFEIAMKRLERLSPMRAELYRRWYSRFYQDSVFLDDVVLEEIDDTALPGRPKGCTLEQIINQRDPMAPKDKRYLISRDLWDKIDDKNHKVGLILHELIYREALEFGAKTSYFVRHFTSYLSSKEFDAFKDLDDLSNYMIKMKIPAIELDGVWISPFHYLRRYVTEAFGGRYMELGPVYPREIVKERDHWDLPGCLYYAYFKWQGVGQCMQLEDAVIYRHENNQTWASFLFKRDRDINVGANTFSGIDRVLLYPSSQVHFFNLPNEHKVKIPNQDAKGVYIYDRVEFHENGVIKQARISKAQTFYFENGTSRTFLGDMFIKFNDKGYCEGSL